MAYDSTRPSTDGTYPVEPKVVAATATATAIGFILDALSNIAQNEDTGALVKGLPEWLEPFVMALALAVPTFVAGYQAKHQHRRPATGATAD